MQKTLTRATIVVAGLVLTLAACGDDTPVADGSRDTGPAPDVVVITPSIDYDKGQYTAEAGTITVLLKNEDTVEHTFTLEDGTREIVKAGARSEATGEIDLEAGTYKVICTIPGHSAMTANLVIT